MARFPIISIIFCLIILGPLTFGFSRIKPVDETRLWLSSSSPYSFDRSTWTNYFNEYEVRFIFTSSESKTTQILNSSYLIQMLRFHNSFDNTFNFSSNCVHLNKYSSSLLDSNYCKLYSILNYFDFNETFIKSLSEQPTSFISSLLSLPKSTPFNQPLVNTSLINSDFTSMQSYYFFHSPLPFSNFPSDITNFLSNFSSLSSSSSDLNIKFSVSPSLPLLHLPGTLILQILIIISFISVFFFNTFLYPFLSSPYLVFHLNSLLSLSVIIFKTITMCAAIGVCGIFNIFFTQNDIIIYFMFQFIGTNHVLSIIHTLERQSSIKHPRTERIVKTMRSCSLPILVEILAIIAGLLTLFFLSKVDAIRFFSLKCTVGFIVHIFALFTFFLGCLTLDAERVDNQRSDVCCIKFEDDTSGQKDDTAYLIEGTKEESHKRGIICVPVLGRLYGRCITNTFVKFFSCDSFLCCFWC